MMMADIKFHCSLLSKILVFALIILLLFQPPARADFWQNVRDFFEGKSQPRPAGTSNQSGSGGTKGLCANLEQPLTALVPVFLNGEKPNQQIDRSVLLTASKHPDLWFYIPQLPHNIQDPSVEFFIQEENLSQNGKEFWRGYRVLPATLEMGEVGIIKFNISSEKELEINKVYRWYFSIVCDPRRPSRNPNVNGRLMRVQLPPTVSQSLKTSSRTEKLDVYSKNALWFDMLSLLMENKCKESNLLDFFTAFGLKGIGQSQLIDCHK